MTDIILVPGKPYFLSAIAIFSFEVSITPQA
jgi:hypothetical protein